MDGNKKIKTVAFLGLVFCFASACSVKNYSYAGLYVDNQETVELLSKSEKESEYVEDRQDDKVTFSSKVIAVRFLQDTISSEKLIYENKSSLTNKASKSEKANSKESQNISEESTHLKAQNKNFEDLKRQLNENQKSIFGTDSTYVLTTAEKLQILNRSDEFQKDSLETKNINSSSNQTYQGSSDGQVQKKDTVFVIREIYRDTEKKEDNSKRENESKTENKRLQERIERLESQQDSQNREPIYIERDAPRERERRDVERSSEVKRYNTNQTTYVPIPMPNLQQNRDTVFVEKEAPMSDTLVIENKMDKFTYDATLNSQKDTINQLKNQLRQKELQQQKTDTIFKTKEVPVFKTQEIDTLRLTAFYEMGKTKPSSNVLEELKDETQVKSVIKVMLSGHTDASGNQRINKALTDRRLDYIKDFISTFIPIDKIYVQNFGNKFASEEVIATERRVEITLYTQLVNELEEIEK